MNPFGSFIKNIGIRDPSALSRLITESKHISTYRGATNQKDSIARLNVSLNPFANRSQRRNHQAARSKLNTIVNSFGQEISRSIRQIRSGLPKGLVVSDLKTMYQDTYHKAYKLGMSASSVGLGADTNYTSEDKRWVESAFKNEMKYFNRFLDQALSTNMSPGQIDHRVSMYMSAVRGVYESGRVIGSHPDSLIYWVYSPEAHHCSSCIYLRDHSPYTKKTLPTTPRTGATECLTNCKCHLRIVISDPDIVKQVNSKSISRNSHLNRLAQLKKGRGRSWSDPDSRS